MSSDKKVPSIRLRGARRRKTMRSIGVYVFAGWCVVPLLWLFSISIHPAQSAFSNNPFKRFSPTGLNYSAVWSEGVVPAALGRSAVMVGFSTLAGIIIAMPLAYVLTQVWEPDEPKANRVTRFFLLMTVIPPIVLMLPFFEIFTVFNLVGSLEGLAVLYSILNVPLAVLLLRSYLASVPHEMREAALVDGAGEWRAMISCVVPIARGGIVATAILCVLQIWNEFLFALVLVGGQHQTLPIAITSFLTFQGINWGGLAAASVIAVMPILAFAMIVQRDLSRGISFGAVK